MHTTLLKLVVSAPDSDLVVPKTGNYGQFTNIANNIGADTTGGGTNHGVIIALVVVAILMIVATTIFIRYKRKSKLGFSIAASKRTMAFRLFVFLAATVALAGAGKVLSSQNGEVEATGNEVNFSASQTVTLQAQLDEDNPVEVCSDGAVVINQALPGGYTLFASASDLKIPSDDSSKISAVGMDGLKEGTWGYIVNPINEPTEQEQTINGMTDAAASVYGVEEATEVGDTTKLRFCVKLSPDTKVGTYESTITYSINPHTVQYSLNYDANGGTFATEPEAQTSDPTIETSYDFVVTDITPTAPEGSALNFYGWSVTGDSLSDIYLAGETIKVEELETTLKAVWGYQKYTITYNKNTNEEVQNFVPTQYCVITTQGATSCNVKITDRIPTISGYTLLGWSKEAFTPADDTTLDQAREKVDYLPNDIAELTEDINLYAVWWKVSTNDFQIELRWGASPRDLDSHLYAVRNSDGRKAFEISFRNDQETIDNGTIKLDANLDIDDTSSYGPETVTLNMLPASAYSEYTFYYYIDNYSTENNGRMKESGANITLIKKDGDISSYSVSTASGASARYWNVFAIKNGQIVDRNTLTSEPEVAY